MKTLEAAEAKAKCSSRMGDVLHGEEFAKKRGLGTLEKKGTVEFSKDWLISDEELCRNESDSFSCNARHNGNHCLIE